MLFICNTEITGVCQGPDEGGLAHTARAHDRDQLVHARNYKIIRQLPDYLMNDQSKSAVEHYKIIVQQLPQYAPAVNNLASAYQQEKNPQALAYAEKAHQLAPENPAILDTLGWILVEQGNTSRGLPLLQKATSLAPQVPTIRYHLAYGLTQAGDKIKARRELEQALASGKRFAEMDEARALLKQIQ